MLQRWANMQHPTEQTRVPSQPIIPRHGTLTATTQPITFNLTQNVQQMTIQTLPSQTQLSNTVQQGVQQGVQPSIQPHPTPSNLAHNIPLATIAPSHTQINISQDVESSIPIGIHNVSSNIQSSHVIDQTLDNLHASNTNSVPQFLLSQQQQQQQQNTQQQQRQQTTDLSFMSNNSSVFSQDIRQKQNNPTLFTQDLQPKQTNSTSFPQDLERKPSLPTYSEAVESSRQFPLEPSSFFNSLPDAKASTSFNQDSTKLDPTKLDPLNVLIKQMSKYHVQDLTLAVTPKGTGCGYGVGEGDLDILMDTISDRFVFSFNFLLCI